MLEESKILSEEAKAYYEQLTKEIDEFLTEYLPSEPNPPASSPKVVHDGLWGTTKLNPTEIRFLDTPLIQRLRQIHQTGCSYFTFPSTTHTRFEHTLGVMLKVEQLGEAIIKNSEEKRLDQKDIGQMRLAALFHDIGHGPFSHTSEEIYGIMPHIECLRERFPGAKPHEILGYLILTSPRFKAFCETGVDANKTDVNPEKLANYIVGQSRDLENPYKRELINGPFDADKLDYLFRDSHFSGLPMSVDLDRLFYTVRIGEAKDKKNRLMVTLRGATALEQILFSKMVLFSTVYQHHKVRACDCMFAGIIEYMQEHRIEMPLRGRTLKWNSPVDFLWVIDNEFLSFGFETDNGELHALIHNLFFRRLLKRALIISRRTVELKDNDRWDELQRHAKKSSNSAKKRRELAREIWKFAGKPCLPQEVWVDLPELPSMKAADDTFVLPSEGAEPITLNKLFPTGQWTSQYGLNKWRGHVFCPPQHREIIGASAKKVLESQYRIEILDEAFLRCKVKPPR
ncbi:MAG: HD domain-containing protein [Desulfobacterales bacterium]|nr:HD domain-containing protein [Desulfobacterales bacterium]MBL7205877.1 HD domain-containing protein [Desulfobacteraceae bacterium]